MSNFAVISFPGSNCDEDCIHALRHVLGHRAERVWHTERSLDGFDAVILPGGFSYGDELGPGAIARTSPILSAVRKFVAQGRPVLGICNGFQILIEAGILPGKLLKNQSGKFICRVEFIRCEETGRTLSLPIAHGFGRYQGDGNVRFRYMNNPNGSIGDIAGIQAGNVLGMMPHPERACEEEIGGSIDGRQIFEAMT